MGEAQRKKPLGQGAAPPCKAVRLRSEAKARPAKVNTAGGPGALPHIIPVCI